MDASTSPPASPDAGAHTPAAGRAWPPGSATGVGSLPGTDVREGVRTVLGELAALPYLPELPARGPGADMIGRAGAVLAEMYAEVRPSGWRLVERPGRDHRRAAAFLGEDLDALEEFTQGFQGPLKVQVAGPWTLAATLELRHGDRALSDPGACRDLAQSLATGLSTHLADVRRRVPGARLLVQLDEPALPGALAGAVPTASGFGALRAVDPADATARLREVVEAVHGEGAEAAVHCCARGVPLAVIRGAGVDGVGVDAALLTARQDEEVATCVEAGIALFLGVVPVPVDPTAASSAGSSSAPSTGSSTASSTASVHVALSEPSAMIEGVRRMWRRIGFAPDDLARDVVATPTCGLAGASPAGARAAMAAARGAGQALRDDPEA